VTKELQLTTLISNNICQRLMEGTPLTRICKDKDQPSLSTVYKWIAKHKDFASKILTARRIGCQTYLDKMIEELETADNKSIMVVREKLHHYRWLSSKLLPNLYGDKQEVIQDTKVTIEWKKPDVVDVSPVDSSQKNGLARVMEFDQKK
tara:strand:+ start:14 stop:460 length:447 start_codon:yes stop_codon:yes gene_type:complete